MVKQDFVYRAMREMDLRYFTVQDASYNLVYMHFQPSDIETSVRKLKSFFDDAGAGMFIVTCYKESELRANGEPKGRPFLYEVMHTETMRKDQPVPMNGMPQYNEPAPVSAMQSMLANGQGMMGGVGMDVYLSAKDKILELQLQIQRLEMEKKYLEDQLSRKESDLRSEFDKKLNNETRIQGIVSQVLPTVMGAFGGAAQPPMNGIPQMEQTMEQDVKNKVIASLNKLLEIDPDFAANIAKLAELAQTKPEVYKMAVQMLKNY
jgi:hypothetical protein